ncbi:hypothetical protein VTK73DRAFT_628 [Phialemonium thermophilum]|uniref:Uncharacterized protein n=1 Tax=Phialemonium thermophilum TaxID=223376 RepID=A0ABR3VUL7_9PEZI
MLARLRLWRKGTGIDRKATARDDPHYEKLLEDESGSARHEDAATPPLVSGRRQRCLLPLASVLVGTSAVLLLLAAAIYVQSRSIRGRELLRKTTFYCIVPYPPEPAVVGRVRTLC